MQTLLCAGLLFYFRREYEFHPLRRPLFTVALALLVFVLWVAPVQFFHFAPRVVGFNPDTYAGSPGLYWSTLILRFVRLVIVVPLDEEIFWRGYLIAERFETVPFGAFSWVSFAIVTLAFCFSHSRPDWPAALLTGALYNCVAYRTKSLSSCVLAHAITNLVLGFWIAATKQWGFWWFGRRHPLGERWVMLATTATPARGRGPTHFGTFYLTVGDVWPYTILYENLQNSVRAAG